jgi:uncharacterized repeat protein (TIGR04076 family)
MKNCNLDLSSITLQVISASHKCKYKPGDKFNLIDLIPPDECLFAIHEVIPYYLTLKKGGYFEWEKDANTAITQCPNTDIAAGIEVRRHKNINKICAKIVSMKSKNCPKKYKKGDKILKSIINNKHICLIALDILVPYILFLEACSRKNKKANFIKIQCSYSNKPTVFKLSLEDS